MDKNKCSSCGEAKCSCKNKDFTKAVIEIDNPEQITLMRKVVIPVSMGDDTAVPPVVGKYHNVLLYYEANHKSYLYSSDGIPTQLVNGVTDYEAAINLPQINGNTLIGDKTGDQLGLQDKLTAGDNITIEDNVISAIDTTYGPATDTEIGLVKPGDGLEVDTDGTISISDIEQYAHTFDTVADMKQATNLVDGDYARTLGFYAINDGGGALYKISNTGTDNEMDVIAVGGLYATLINPENVKQFGSTGDGTTDDTACIQRAVTVCRNLYIPSGTYMVDGQYDETTQSAILVPDNTNIKLSPDATLKVIPNAYTHYQILNVYQASNVKIEGGNLLGDKTTHLDTSGEWGFGVYIRESSDVVVKNMHIDDMWGDGIVITDGTNVITEGLIINNCRRNGYTISSGLNVHSINDTIMNIVGTAPQAGVDLEPDNEAGYMQGIVFDNLTTTSCYTWGLSIQLRYMDGSENIDIKINNHHDNGSGRALLIAKSASTVGNIEINQPFYENTKMSAITFMRAYDSKCKISINKPHIVNCNTSLQTSNQFSCGISCFFDTGQEVGDIGNITIYEPYIVNARTAQVNGIFIDPSTASLNNFSIINPLNSPDKNRINCVVGKHIFFLDTYEKFVSDIASSYTLAANNWYSLYTNTAATANTTITLPSGIDDNRELTFLNSCKTKSLSIKLDASEYCTQLGPAAGLTIKLDNFGDRITLRKFDSTSWIVKDINCAPTIA